MSIVIPRGLEVQRRLGPDWADWLDRLPGLTAELVEEWGLVLDGPVWHGFCSLVPEVRTEDGTPAILKLTFDGDDESEHEGVALQHWAGRGTVQLLRADPHRRALLLERLGHEDLATVGYVEAAEIVGGLYTALHVPALPQLRTVTSYVDGWLDDLATLARGAPVPRRMVEQALHLGRALVSDPASTGVIVHGDLHDHNVLAAAREPWLVIDPKPMSGDPAYEPAPLLWNRWEEIATGDVRTAVRSRFHALVDAAGIDERRARDWVVVRMVINAHWTIQDGERTQRSLDQDERDWITRCIAIVKAVQD
ncbi:MAG: aminoglycoside phosphotransferase family protein [Nocardioides sp.]